MKSPPSAPKAPAWKAARHMTESDEYFKVPKISRSSF
jgi:hypothetical protein